MKVNVMNPTIIILKTSYIIKEMTENDLLKTSYIIKEMVERKHDRKGNIAISTPT